MAQLLTDLGKWVEENEHDTIRYQLHRENNRATGVEELIMIERYVCFLRQDFMYLSFFFFIFFFDFPSIRNAFHLHPKFKATRIKLPLLLTAQLQNSKHFMLQFRKKI